MANEKATVKVPKEDPLQAKDSEGKEPLQKNAEKAALINAKEKSEKEGKDKETGNS